MTQFFFFGKIIQWSLKKVNEELNNIDNWLIYNKLSLNYNKTHYMLITIQIKTLDFDMNMNII